MNEITEKFFIVILLFLLFQEAKMIYLYLRLVLNKPKIKKVERTGYYTVYGEAVYYVMPLDGSLKYNIKVKTTILSQFLPFFLGREFYVILYDDKCVLLAPISIINFTLLIFFIFQFSVF